MTRFGGEFLRNFGDELSARVIEMAAGSAPRWSRLERADVVAVGSVLNLYAERGSSARIWGSGLRSPKVDGNIPPKQILAVRGRLTRDALGCPRATPLGDPGLIVRRLKWQTPQTGTLVLPHFATFAKREGIALLERFESSGYTVLAPSASVDAVCSAIAGADHVITSSLHGLVVGDALRTPTTLARFLPTREPEFKYDDYLSVFDEKAAFVGAANLLDERTHLEASDLARARVERIDEVVDRLVEDLLDAASDLA